MIDEIADYAHKALLLRQISPDIAWRFGLVSTIQSLATVVVASLLLFIGLSGIVRTHPYLTWLTCITTGQPELIFSLLVFAILALLTLRLAFGFTKRQSEAEAAVARLTGFVNEVDGIVAAGGKLRQLGETDLNMVHHKYTAIAGTLPQHGSPILENPKECARQRGPEELSSPQFGRHV